MPPSSSSSSPLLLLLLPLLLPPLQRLAAAAEELSCRDAFRTGQDDFVLDVEDAVTEGAALLSTVRVRTLEACRSACCLDDRCNLALLEPRGPAAGAAGAAEHRVCVMFDCIHRNRFVCRFVNKAGYQSYIREEVFQKYLRGPTGSGESTWPIRWSYVSQRSILNHQPLLHNQYINTCTSCLRTSVTMHFLSDVYLCLQVRGLCPSPSRPVMSSSSPARR